MRALLCGPARWYRRPVSDKFEKVAGALVYAGVRRVPVLAYLDDVAKKLRTSKFAS